MKAILLALFLGAGIVGAGDDEAASVREAIGKALPFLEEEGVWWIEKKKCVSCHHTTFLLWAKELAVDAGFPVDWTVLDEQREWVWNEFLEEIQPDPKRPENQPKPGEVKGDRNVEGVSQFLLSPSSEKVPPEVIASLQEIVTSNQGDDGNWKPGGQLPRQDRPVAETQWASNLWATLALSRRGVDPSRPAETWKEGVAAVTSEWQMLNVLTRPGNPHSLKNLLGRQNDDGGWSWKEGEGSDPSATGQALIALGRTGHGRGHPEAMRRAREFLVTTQSEDGHWETRGTKDREEFTRVSRFWGTSWAVIGLLESLRSETSGRQVAER